MRRFVFNKGQYKCHLFVSYDDFSTQAQVIFYAYWLNGVLEYISSPYNVLAQQLHTICHLIGCDEGFVAIKPYKTRINLRIA